MAYGAVVYVSDTTANFVLLLRNLELLRVKEMLHCLDWSLWPRVLEVCFENQSALDFPIDEAKYWSDLKIVLTWIKQDVDDLKQFVSNRVKIIQQNTKEMNWDYIRFECNPDDIVSHGCTITTLQSSMLWWQGPSEVMTEDHDAMTKEEINSFENDVRSKSSNCPNQSLNILANNTSHAQSVIDVKRFSTWKKLLRVTAYVLRFIKNCRKSSKETSDHLTCAEIEAAEQKWIKEMQRDVKEEFLSFENKTERSLRSRLTKMSPFIDADGFVRSKTSNENNEPLPISSRANHLCSFSRQQTLLTHFCNRFKREYFTSLKQLATGNHWDGRRVGLGNLVLLRSDQTKCFNWPLGRVTKLYPGPDGITRVVLMESGGVTLRRAVSSLVALELDNMKT